MPPKAGLVCESDVALDTMVTGLLANGVASAPWLAKAAALAVRVKYQVGLMIPWATAVAWASYKMTSVE